MRLELTYWHSTLQGKSLPIHENDPQEGWYRTRPRKGYRSLPVRIWREEASGGLLAVRDGRRVDPYEVWTWVCLNPVSVDAYEAVLEGRGPWPDEVTTSAYHLGGPLADPIRSPMSAVQSVRRQQPKGERRTLAQTLSGPNRPHVSVTPKQTTARWDTNGPYDRVTEGNDQSQQVSHTSSARVSHSKALVKRDPNMSYDSVSVIPDRRMLPPHEDGVRGIEGKLEPGLITASPQKAIDASASSVTSGSLASELSRLRHEVSNWLEGLGEIADQVTADRCANYADAFASFEKQAEEQRTSAKKPVLDQGRAIDQRWKPIVSAAEDAKRQCKKALEPFLIAETERLEREFMEQLQAENGDLSLLGLASLTAKAGTFGRTISLRRVRKVRILNRNALLAHYHRDPRFLNDEAVQKLLGKLAEHDLQSGSEIPGVELTEEKVAA